MLRRIDADGQVEGRSRESVESEKAVAELQAAAEAARLDDSALLAGNEQAIKDAARSALPTNRSHLALAKPSAAQTTAEVKALARLLLGLLKRAGLIGDR